MLGGVTVLPPPTFGGTGGFRMNGVTEPVLPPLSGAGVTVAASDGRPGIGAEDPRSSPRAPFRKRAETR